MSTIVFDCEANGFLYDATKIHLIVTNVLDTDVITAYAKEAGVRDALEELKKADILIGHNIAGFDVPLIKKLYGVDLSPKILIDTMLISYLRHPDILGGHKLEAWMKRLGLEEFKIYIDDWSRLTPAMVDRCVLDVKANTKVYHHLKDEVHPDVLEDEVQVALIQAEQELTGVGFDKDKALGLLADLDGSLRILRSEITKDIPPEIKKVGAGVAKPWKKDGSLTVISKNYLEKHMLITEDGDDLPTRYMPAAIGPFSPIKYKEFNLDSPKQVTDYLLSLGWKPTEWNYKDLGGGKKEKTSPKLTESSWGSLPGKLGKKIGQYKMLSHRRRWLLNHKDPTKGALKTIREDGRVPAEAITCGTPTYRYRHTKTVCNIPRPSTPYGKEIRELFIGDLIGLDLKGIEARMLVHYCMHYPGGDALARIILAGDFHANNAALWDVSRDIAKNGLYALMYGCTAPKLASTLGKKVSEGKQLLEDFWDAYPAIKALVEALEYAYTSGKTIRSVDGRVLYIREKRKLLNSLLQGSAAVVFKKWMIKCDELVKEINYSESRIVIKQVIAYHDELQFDTWDIPLLLRLKIARKMCDLATVVGKDLKLKVPIEASPKIGRNWKQTH
jgi:DNA polymerase I-like protein with 3'-5' exonuclease and polymerase domains